MEILLDKWSAAMWGWPMMALFLGTGLLYTLRLGGIQFFRLPMALRSIGRRGEGQGIRPYDALCTSLAATIGTGNIVGVATAMSIGGPGALFWMLVAAFFGMATQYAEGFLAVCYRKTGERWGGPFAYIRKGLGKRFRWLAGLFALTGGATGLFGVGTVTQVNSITAAMDAFFPSCEVLCIQGRGISLTVLLTGLLVTCASGAVLLGGAKRITKVCRLLVPVMSGIYLFFSLLLLLRNSGRIPEALSLVLHSAFSPKAALGACTGISLKTAMRMGIGRGVFTNEAGLGTSAIAAAASNEEEPVRQGLVSMTGTFIDTILICTLTGLCLLVTGAWEQPLPGTQLTGYAWETGLPFPGRFSAFMLLLCLVFFAFATIIGWNFYGESCLRYLCRDDQKVQKPYRMVYLLMIALAPFLTGELAWSMADLMNGLLALPNLTALLLLQNKVVKGSRDWFRRPHT